ncbi:MAG: DUF4089 domain-containing protein [Nodularia sp. CChRGM 3473]
MKKEQFNLATYVEQMACLLDLQLRDEDRDGVLENFARIQAIAQLVNEFPLPEEIEIYNPGCEHV